MKKIIVFALVVALCIPVLASCKLLDTFKNPLKDITEMYSMSDPTKVEATVKHEIGSTVLNNSYKLIIGTVDGSRASVYVEHKEELDSVENGGATEVVQPLVKQTDTITEAIEGTGSRTTLNGKTGSWDPDGNVYTIGRGRMALNLTKKLVENVTYEDHVLNCTVPAGNAGAVLGEDYATYISGDVSITIEDDGAMITYIKLVYKLAADASKNLPESTMTVEVNYSYDIEQINIG